MADGEAVVNLKKMKVAELKKELVDRGLPTKGNKSELLDRLEKCLAEQGVVVSQDESDLTDEHEVEDELDNDIDDLEDVDDGDDGGEPDVSIDVLEEQPKTNEEISTGSQEDEKLGKKTVTAKPVSIKKTPIMPPGEVSKKSNFTEEEKKSQRLKRFGQSLPSTDDGKKQARAQRFGISSPAANGAVKKSANVNTAEVVDVDKLKKRAERFGAVSPVVTKIEESDKLLKRKQRFGVPVGASLGDDVAAKKKRAERFGL